MGSKQYGYYTRKGYTGCDTRDITDADFDKLDKENKKLEE